MRLRPDNIDTVPASAVQAAVARLPRREQRDLLAALVADATGTTYQDFTWRAAQALKAILGAERGPRFVRLVSEGWRGEAFREALDHLENEAAL